MMSVGNIQGAVSQPLSNLLVDLLTCYAPKPVVVPLKVLKMEIRSKAFNSRPERAKDLIVRI